MNVIAGTVFIHISLLSNTFENTSIIFALTKVFIYAIYYITLVI